MDDPRRAQDGSDSREVNRRDFLAGAVRLAGGAFAILCGAPAVAGAERYDWEAHRWAYLVDTTRCIGCGACVRGCKAENGVPDGYFRTWVERYATSLEAAHVDSPNGGLDGFPPLQVAFTPAKSFFVPKLCNHCKETPCVQVCPVGASYRTKDGVVLVDGERCIGCGYCVQACPYGSRFLSHEHGGTAEKCTWCYHRITKGLRPVCVEVCPTQTRNFGDMLNEHDPVRARIEHERVAVLQPHLLTEPQCFYVGLDKEVR
jgi:Fe-S-cluster-containing dehydrogenase component